MRVVLELKVEDVIHILSLVYFEISKAEISALYRKEDHSNYRACGAQNCPHQMTLHKNSQFASG